MGIFKSLLARLRSTPQQPGGVGPPSSIGIQSADINDILDEDGNVREVTP